MCYACVVCVFLKKLAEFELTKERISAILCWLPSLEIFMFELDFYTNASGHSDILELLRDLNKRAKTNKTSRIRLKKITEYFTLLENFGFTLGYPYIKHIAGTELWELRPVSDRIFFCFVEGKPFDFTSSLR